MTEAQATISPLVSENQPPSGPAAPRTFAKVLRARARRQGDRLALSFLVSDEREESVTYAELDLRARAVAAALQQRTHPGDRVLLLYPPGLSYVAALFGCFYAGCVAVPAYPPRRNRKFARIEAIVAEAEASVALTTPAILSWARELFHPDDNRRGFEWLASDDVADDLSNEWQAPEATAESLALLQFTSGSTAEPRGVMVTHANLLNNSEIISQSFGHSGDSQGVIWLPPYHDMGLIGGILQPIYAGFPCALMSPIAFLQRPVRWLRAITRYGGTTSGGPNFAYELCLRRIKPEQREQIDLSSWTVAFNGAEPIEAETLNRFADFFQPCGFRREALYPCYGLAESTLMVTGGTRLTLPKHRTLDADALRRNEAITVSPSPGPSETRDLVSCGRPVADHQTVIVDPRSQRLCERGQIGEIWVSGPSVAQAYWGRKEDTERTFRAFLDGSRKGPFLRTGDLGVLLDGELYVTGRCKEVLIIRGRNYYPHDIERTVRESHAALLGGDGAAFTISVNGDEQLAIAHEVDRHAAEDYDQLLMAIRQRVAQINQLQVYAIALLPPRSTPKTSSGKVQRQLCRRNYLENKLGPLVDWRLDAVGEQSATQFT